ncbi:unnamed protein product [Didymodactylos carnosus]|uniref:Uncharacterized protein n=1 Tax=Didymodactylos carnosus TaxID=1234261 RepID=A0A814LQW7_9BILA|nr:unnamed protein product [Didymodactylos carnosus]CAF3834642.1 unnamed protein product [Didymodactylos carnosus]
MRTPDGWLSEQTHPLNLSKHRRFSKVHGITFNMETGEINFLFQPECVISKDGLFDVNDVKEVLANDITSSTFTLDPPNSECRWHPFQEMKYTPSALSNTNYKNTLLYAGYLLKMISTDIEVCSKPPFQMRQISNGFMKRLPEWLQNKLKPINNKLKLDNLHRFWIEAQKITYQADSNKNRHSNILTYYLGDVKMYVKTQLMQYDEKGHVIGDTNDQSNSNDLVDDSPEAHFARTFTKYYDQIGLYFPELLRLKELLQL